MILDAERAFWDAKAEEAARPGPPGGPEGAPPLDRFAGHLLAAAGPLSGLDVLELGCGDGEMTLRLAEGGAASVTALDASSGQVERARGLVIAHGPGARVQFVTAPAEETGLPATSFDVIVGKWVPHHLDVPRAVPEVARLLRPDGRAVFYENQDRNPLLAWSRGHLAGRFRVARLGTATERPLGENDIALLRRHFTSVERRYPEFFFFTMLSSRALGYRGYRALAALDQLIWGRAPGLRPLSWHVLLVCRGPRP